jgi:hemerythrin-like domain-containing protein
MKPTDELKNEHAAIKTLLEILAKMSGRLDSGREIEPADLEGAVEFIRVFADKCHHAKEEDILFPAMIAAGLAKDGGPIAVMLDEHAQGREFVKKFGEGVAKYKAGDKASAAQISRNARGYASLLGRHIEKEDFILYPMADTIVPIARQKEILGEFENVEENIVGHGRHERFHEMLDRLAGVYLA